MKLTSQNVPGGLLHAHLLAGEDLTEIDLLQPVFREIPNSWQRAVIEVAVG